MLYRTRMKAFDRLPPVLRFEYRLMLLPAMYVWVALLVIHAGGALLYMSNVWPASLWQSTWNAHAIAPPVAVILVLRHWLGPLGSLPRELIAGRFRLCGHCGYALRGGPEVGTCPECGCFYDIRRLVPMWRAWIRKRVTLAFFRSPSNAGMLIAGTLVPGVFAPLRVPAAGVILLIGLAALTLIVNWRSAVKSMAKDLPPWDESIGGGSPRSPSGRG
jgi:hypothetical protein